MFSHNVSTIDIMDMTLKNANQKRGMRSIDKERKKKVRRKIRTMILLKQKIKKIDTKKSRRL